MTRTWLCLVSMALACGCLVATCGRGLTQLVVDGDAIGDPWWDDAEGTHAGRRNADGRNAEDAAAAEPAEVGQKLLFKMQMVQIQRHGMAVLRRELSVVRQA